MVCEEKKRLESPVSPQRDHLFVKLPAKCNCPDAFSPYHKHGKRKSSCDIAEYVRVIWSALSILVTFTCCYAFTQPCWLNNKMGQVSFGMFNYCLRDSVLSQTPGKYASYKVEKDIEYIAYFTQTCGPYGQYFRLAHLPSNAWQIACVLFGGGSCLMAFGAIAALVTSFLADWWAARIAGYTGYIQTMAVITCAGGLLTFPLGMDSDFVRHYCPNAGMYSTGSCCQVGWSYLLGIMGTALAAFCPYLSQYVTFREKEIEIEYL